VTRRDALMGAVADALSLSGSRVVIEDLMAASVRVTFLAIEPPDGNLRERIPTDVIKDRMRKEVLVKTNATVEVDARVTHVFTFGEDGRLVESISVDGATAGVVLAVTVATCFCCYCLVRAQRAKAGRRRRERFRGMDEPDSLNMDDADGHLSPATSPARAGAGAMRDPRGNAGVEMTPLPRARDADVPEAAPVTPYSATYYEQNAVAAAAAQTRDSPAPRPTPEGELAPGGSQRPTASSGFGGPMPRIPIPPAIPPLSGPPTNRNRQPRLQPIQRPDPPLDDLQASINSPLGTIVGPPSTTGRLTTIASVASPSTPGDGGTPAAQSVAKDTQLIVVDLDDTPRDKDYEI